MRNYSYKGFKCVNISKDSSFPYYAIISPKGEDIEHTLFPSDMKEIVDNYLKGETNLESSESPEELKANKSSLRALNKKIGRNSSDGMEYLSEAKLNSIISKTLRKVLRENISSKHGEHTFDN